MSAQELARGLAELERRLTSVERGSPLSRSSLEVDGDVTTVPQVVRDTRTAAENLAALEAREGRVAVSGTPIDGAPWDGVSPIRRAYIATLLTTDAGGNFGAMWPEVFPNGLLSVSVTNANANITKGQVSMYGDGYTTRSMFYGVLTNGTTPLPGQIVAVNIEGVGW